MLLMRRVERESTAELNLWRSTDVLPEETQARICTLTFLAEVDVTRLNIEISRLQPNPSLIVNGQQLDDFTTQRDGEITRISILRDTSSALKKIPPELLTQIFLNCRRKGVQTVVIPPQWRIPMGVGPGMLSLETDIVGNTRALEWHKSSLERASKVPYSSSSCG
jgi:hypothetical protein